MQAAIAAIGARQVHIVCNNAGISVGNAGLLDVTLTQWEWFLGVNIFGVVHGVQILVPHIRQHGEGGHIVNTASMAGLQANFAIPGIGAYAMTKHAVVALSEGLVMELRGSDIGTAAGLSRLRLDRRGDGAHQHRLARRAACAYPGEFPGEAAGVAGRVRRCGELAGHRTAVAGRDPADRRLRRTDC